MRRSDSINIKRKAKLWGIYEITKDGITPVGQEITLQGKPDVKPNQQAILLKKGHFTFSMLYEVFMENATKSDFIEEEEHNEN